MEAAAYWKLVEQHLPALKEHARKMVYYLLRNTRPGSIYTAEDLLHDCLIKVGKSTTSQAEQPDPDWFLKVCKVAMRNIAYDLLRTVDAKQTDTITDASYSNYGNMSQANSTGRASTQLALSDRQLTPLELLEKQDEDHALEEALHQLYRVAPIRACVLLYSMDVDEANRPGGDNHTEKAKELGISRNSYAQHLFQGIKHLKRVLKP